MICLPTIMQILCWADLLVRVPFALLIPPKEWLNQITNLSSFGFWPIKCLDLGGLQILQLQKGILRMQVSGETPSVVFVTSVWLFIAFLSPMPPLTELLRLTESQTLILVRGNKTTHFAVGFVKSSFVPLFIQVPKKISILWNSSWSVVKVHALCFKIKWLECIH